MGQQPMCKAIWHRMATAAGRKHEVPGNPRTATKAMGHSTTQSQPAFSPRSLLEELEARQDEVLSALEQLNARLEQVLAACQGGNAAGASPGG
jgi:hypothetical protein